MSGFRFRWSENRVAPAHVPVGETKGYEQMTIDLIRRVHGQELPAAGVWEIPPERTSIQFTLRRPCARPVRGHLQLEDGIMLIATDPHASVAAISIDATSLSSARRRRDARMRTRLATDRYPTIDLYIDEVEQQTRWEWTALGRLSVRSTTHLVALCFTYDGVNDRGDAKFRARTTLSVADLGIGRRWSRWFTRSLSVDIRVEASARPLFDIPAESDGLAAVSGF